jgi:hypothetical protein
MEANPGKSMRPYLKNKLKAKGLVVWPRAQAGGLGFNPQYCPIKKQKIGQDLNQGLKLVVTLPSALFRDWPEMPG